MFLFFDEVDFVQTQNLPIRELWAFMPFGYLVTILIETPTLLIGLTRKLTVGQKIRCGIWLTACTYPIVVLVLPAVFYGSSRGLYLLVAETFAPLAECLIFWLAFRRRSDLTQGDLARSFAAIVTANLASFGAGELLGHYNWFGMF